MNAIASIRIVTSADLRALSQARNALQQIQTMGRAGAGGAAGAAGGFFGNVKGSLNDLERFGKNIQWTGRQIEYSFTLPIVAAGAAATKWALDNDRAFTELSKVYGGLGQSSDQLNLDLKYLRQGFEILSNMYGIQQKEVIGVAAAWAQAGFSGLTLAKNVRTTIETSLLGGQALETAAQSLIAIQASFGLTADELKNAVAQLNIIENETTVSFGGLIEAIQRGGGVARTAGVDVRHFGAMVAALVPASGSAASAGNGLKTIFSRLLAPTKQAAEVMKLAGINVFDAGWQAKNGSERLETLAKAFAGLTRPQQAVFSSLVAGRFQINRLDILLRDINNPLGQYHKALEVSSDALDKHSGKTRVAKQYQDELNKVMMSTPKQFDVAKTMIQNALTKAILPMLPSILGLIQRFAELAQAFNNMDPSTQQFILVSLALLAVLGPVARYIGATIQVVTLLGKAFFELAKIIVGIPGFLIDTAKFLNETYKKLAKDASDLWEFLVKGWQLVARFTVAAWNGAAKAVNVAWTIMSAGASLVWGAITSVATRLKAFVVEWGAVDGVIVAENVAAAAATEAAWGVSLAHIFAMVAGLSTGFAELPAAAGAATAASGVVIEAGFTEIGVGSGLALDAGVATGITAGTAGIVAAVIAAAVAATAAMYYVLYRNRGTIVKLLLPTDTLRQTAKNWVNAVQAGIGNVIKAVGAGGGVIVRYFHNLGQAIVDTVFNTFKWLPKIVFEAIKGVIKILQTAAGQVIKWLSYLNPFAKHSPSLVESVQLGVAEILNKYQYLGSGIANALAGGVAALRAFQGATAGLSAKDRGEDLFKIAGGTGGPNSAAVGAAKGLIASMNTLNGYLAISAQRYLQQERVVTLWKIKLDAASAAVDRQKDALDALEKIQGRIKDQIDAAQESLQKFANTPIKGLRAMEDQIFANEMAQKRLHLEIMKLEEATGPIDEINRKLAALQGEIESTASSQAGLRLAGAGSEITGPFDQRIRQLREQQKTLTHMADPIKNLQKELDRLGTVADRLDLEKALKFDPLQRQIDQLANSIEELPFQTILEGVLKSRIEINKLQPSYDAITAAVDRNKAHLDELETTRDALQKSYDLEKQKLDDIGAIYDALESQIRDMESALNDMASAASNAADKLKKAKEESFGVQEFKAAGLGDYPDVGGTAPGAGQPEAISEEDWKKYIDDLNKDLGNAMKDFDPWKPFKDAWAKAKDKFHDEIWGPIMDAWHQSVKDAKQWGWDLWHWFNEGWQAVVGFFGGIGRSVWDGIKSGASGAFRGAVGFFKGLWDPIKSVFLTAIGGIVQAVFPAFGPILLIFHTFGDTIKNVVTTAVEKLGDIFSKVWDGIKGAVQTAWDTVLGPVFQAISGAINTWLIPPLQLLGAIFSLVWFGISTALQVAWDKVIGPIFGFIGVGVAGLIGAFIGLGLNLDFVWNFIKDVINAVWTFIRDQIFTPIVNFVKGPLAFAFDFIRDVASLAWTIIRDNISAVWNFLRDQVFQRIIDFLRGPLTFAYDFIRDAATLAWTIIRDYISGVWNFLRDDVWQKLIDFIYGPLATVFFWLRDNVIKPVWDGIRDIILGGVHAIAKVFNILATGVEDVGRAVGHTVKIGRLPEQAQGGTVPKDAAPVGAGFKVAHARAIVGEGSSVYPEYVIPTDPKYRRRAMGLAGQLGNDIGMFAAGGVIPKEAEAGHNRRGFFDRLVDTAKSAAGFVAAGPLGPIIGIAEKILGGDLPSIAWRAVKAVVNPMIDQIPLEFFRNIAHGIIDWIDHWLTDQDKEVANQHQNQSAPGGPVPPGSVRDWLVQAIGLTGVGMDWLEPLYRRTMQESGGNPRAINLWDDNAKRGTPSKGLLQTIDSTFRSFMLPGHGDIWNPIDNAIAAIRYMIAKYGSVFGLPVGGYAAGGVINDYDKVSLLGQPLASQKYRKLAAALEYKGIAAQHGYGGEVKRNQYTQAAAWYASLAHLPLGQRWVRETTYSGYDPMRGIFTKSGIRDLKKPFDAALPDIGLGLRRWGENAIVTEMLRFDKKPYVSRAQREAQERAHLLSMLRTPQDRALFARWIQGHPQMGNGGVVLARPGGTLVNLGERGRDEAVVPLTGKTNSGRTINIYGNIELPNITSPEDADKFLDNLERLAES